MLKDTLKPLDYEGDVPIGELQRQRIFNDLIRTDFRRFRESNKLKLQKQREGRKLLVGRHKLVSVFLKHQVCFQCGLPIEDVKFVWKCISSLP